jgi:thiamine kinase-like enzyme
MTPADAVVLLSATLGQQYTLIGPLAGGETGATAIRDLNGQLHVLKWEADPDNRIRRVEGTRLAERLRTEAGWPVPQQKVIELDDLLFVMQEFMAGDPVTELTMPIVDDLLALHQSRIGLARTDDTNRWAADLIETLIDGGNGYCLHDPLRQHDDRTRRVVEWIEELGRSLDPADLGSADVIHYDLHSGNLLQVDGRLAAVVDLDFAQVGDAAFDLASLAVSSLATSVEPGVRSRLFDSVAALPAPRRSAYYAHLVLRNLDWPIRKGRTDDVEFWLAQAEHLLPET